MMVPLHIISDPVCPWCYIGKANLEAALKEVPENPFDIYWQVFMLNPDMPSEGMDRTAYLTQKFGAERAKSFYKQIEDNAVAAGLEVDFAAIKRTPSTIDAHRLIRWSRTVGVQNAVVDQLFDRYFRQGQDISDHDVLVEAAEHAGMETDIVRQLLSGDADAQEVRDEHAKHQEIGVNSVPTFIVNHQHAVPGAQPKDMWVQIIKDIYAALEARKNGVSTA